MEEYARDISHVPAGWKVMPDPEFPDESIAVSKLRDGTTVALARSYAGDAVSVLKDIWVYQNVELGGESMGDFPTLDAALEFVNPLMELEVD